MCGINGIVAYHYTANGIDRAELVRTRDHMAARGPDGMGAWIDADGRVGLAHRRLAIIDLSDAGAQPMVSTNGKVVITFNGEIYNYRELRSRLEAKGHAFRSRSDTEVLLHLYAQNGEAMVRDLRGMFAFAIWDAERRTLLLARDHYGIKPLYYSDDGWTFRFASQVKALLAGGAVSTEREPAGQVGFYVFGSVPEPFTAYRQVQALPAGATVVVDRIGACEPRRYHSIAKVYCCAEVKAQGPHGTDRSKLAREVRHALLDSIRAHLVADVPVGVFLSGGIDSGALVGLMRDAGQTDIEAVTLAFGEYRGRAEDEAPLAQEVVRLYGARHTTRVVLAPDVVAEGLRRLAPLRLIDHAIEPRPRSAYAKVAVLEASLYMRNQLLRDTDWSSMAHGVEVRVPLVDHVLLRTVASAACTGGWWSEPGVAKASLASSPSTPLPERLMSRAKTGFTTPIGSWLQSPSLPPIAPLAHAGRRPKHWARQWAERLAAV
jgi:asparagine synthase (glutamine-hydrolysing)